MREWIVAFGLLAFGSFIFWRGLRAIRLSLHEDGLPAIEDAILRATGQEPLPRTGLDRFLGALNSWLAVIFGPLCLGLGVVIVARNLGVLE